MTNAEFNEKFRKRTLAFAVRTIKFLNLIPAVRSTNVVAYQLGKSATSVGANFRAFCRGRSKNERYAKMCIVVEEADESQYWLLLIKDLEWGDKFELDHLLNEIDEIVRVVTKIKHAFRP